MKPTFFLLLLLTVSYASTKSNGRNILIGGWAPIKNLTDTHVLEIANFAVSEHNKEANSNLGFGKIVKGETQVVAGMNYKLVVEAKDGGSYEAVVWEKAWENFRKLTSFKPL